MNAAPSPNGESPAPLQATFPCRQCGAALRFTPGQGSLKCPWCGYESPIDDLDNEIREYDLREAIAALNKAEKTLSDTEALAHCTTCGAEFTLDPNITAGDCPFCGRAVVTAADKYRLFKPRALLPFRIEADQARAAFEKWLRGLWFAPNALSRHARADDKLTGIYLPYWTYDSDATTHYNGLRGDIYYVSVQVPVIVNGRRVIQHRREPRIRWTPASGIVRRHFDDVLVGATQTLPRTITDELEPWDLDALVPYQEDYLAGFRGEVYQVRLDEGFQLARKRMDHIIREDVRRAIGGDQQRISQLRTHHENLRFKHILLPVWAAAFRYRGKSYRFVINGRTGRVRGERPYSRVKIALAIIAGLALTAGSLYLLTEYGQNDRSEMRATVRPF